MIWYAAVQMRYYANVTNSKKRTLRKAPAKRSGGRWGDGVRSRLKRLQVEHELSQREFATRCGVFVPRVSEWLSGRTLPSADNLRAIGEAFGVSLDWLLFGLGWDGSPKDAPVYRSQSSTKLELEQELAVHVARELRRQATQDDAEWIAPVFSRETLDARALLQEAVRLVAEDMRREQDYVRKLRQEAGLYGLAVELAEWVPEIVQLAAGKELDTYEGDLMWDRPAELRLRYLNEVGEDLAKERRFALLARGRQGRSLAASAARKAARSTSPTSHDRSARTVAANQAVKRTRRRS